MRDTSSNYIDVDVCVKNTDGSRSPSGFAFYLTDGEALEPEEVVTIFRKASPAIQHVRAYLYTRLVHDVDEPTTTAREAFEKVAEALAIAADSPVSTTALLNYVFEIDPDSMVTPDAIRKAILAYQGTYGDSEAFVRANVAEIPEEIARYVDFQQAAIGLTYPDDDDGGMITVDDDGGNICAFRSPSVVTTCHD